ncbi:UPF0149 family protein [Pseudomonas sp. A-1]|uniref:UPF0149 family protein n=1 Tax=Pseudomonas sp. A-1 TaxID=1821274 RepID=UPI0010A63458|nr:UPF0149 family protein [Pseudomonas sp. A-1]THG81147.1 UPF0149 family protein [Pseudomonas sp. A-1]
MSLPASAYSAFAALLSGSGQSISPAELHGLLLGRTCAGAGFDPDLWLAAAAELLDAAPDERLRQALLGLQAMVRSELEGGELSLVLLLPADEAPLAERAAALGQWCQGFLAGFGLTAREGKLSAEAGEVLQDLAAIARIEESLEESEDAENDYMEVMEYLRVAPLLLLSECGGLPVKPAADAKPSLH